MDHRGIRRDRSRLPRTARVSIAAVAACVVVAGALEIWTARVRSGAPELSLGPLDTLGLTAPVNLLLAWAHGIGVVAIGVGLVGLAVYLLVLFVEYAGRGRQGSPPR